MWDPKGSFIIDPDDGLVFHPPTKPSSQRITFDPKRRVFFRHDLWLIDIVYTINKFSTKVTEVRLEVTFRIFKEDDVFVVERKIEHKLYPYRWPYVIRCYPDGRFQIALKRPVLPIRVLKQAKRYFWR